MITNKTHFTIKKNINQQDTKMTLTQWERNAGKMSTKKALAIANKCLCAVTDLNMLENVWACKKQEKTTAILTFHTDREIYHIDHLISMPPNLKAEIALVNQLIKAATREKKEIHVCLANDTKTQETKFYQSLNYRPAYKNPNLMIFSTAQTDNLETVVSVLDKK